MRFKKTAAAVTGAVAGFVGLTTAAFAAPLTVWEINNPPVEAIVGAQYSYTFNLDSPDNCMTLVVDQGALPVGIQLTAETLSGVALFAGGAIYTVNEGLLDTTTGVCVINGPPLTFQLIAVANGASGNSGNSGSNGTTGAQGPAGATGATGASGVSGAVGPAGPPGAAGTNGTNGTNGTSGSSPATAHFAQLQILNIHGHRNGRTFNFQVNDLSSQPTLQVTFWKAMHDGRDYKKEYTVTASSSLGIFVRTDWAIRVRTMGPTSNVMVEIG